MTSIVLEEPLIYILSYMEKDKVIRILFDDFRESVAAFKDLVSRKNVKPSITQVDLEKMTVADVDFEDIAFVMATLTEDVKSPKKRSRLKLFGR